MKKKVEPMSEIGEALASKDGAIHLKKLTELLDLELIKVDQAVRRGLDKEAFEKIKAQQMALASAKLVLKTIHIYHANS